MRRKVEPRYASDRIEGAAAKAALDAGLFADAPQAKWSAFLAALTRNLKPAVTRAAHVKGIHGREYKAHTPCPEQGVDDNEGALR